MVMDADGSDEMASSGEAEDAYLVRVDAPLGCMKTNETECALGVFEGDWGLRVGSPVGPGARGGNPVFEQDAGDASRGEPVAGFGAFKVDGEDLVAAAGKDDDSGAGVVLFRWVNGDGGGSDVLDVRPGLAGYVVFGLGCPGDLRTFSWAGIGGAVGGPDRDLRVAGRWLPDGLRGDWGADEEEEENSQHV